MQTLSPGAKNSDRVSFNEHHKASLYGIYPIIICILYQTKVIFFTDAFQRIHDTVFVIFSNAFGATKATIAN